MTLTHRLHMWLNCETLPPRTLKAWEILVIFKDQFSQLVYLNICTKYQSCENLNPIGRRRCEIIMEEEKTPLLHEVVCFQMPNFGTSQSKIVRYRNHIQIFQWNIIQLFGNLCVTSEGFVSHNVLYYQQLILFQVSLQAVHIP